MKKRLVSLLLSLLMVLTLLPVPALAEESGGATDAEPDIAVQAAEEEIPTEDEGEEEEAPSSTVIIDSITCVDADEDGYVRMMEGEDAYFVGLDDNKNVIMKANPYTILNMRYVFRYKTTADGEIETFKGYPFEFENKFGGKLTYEDDHKTDSEGEPIAWRAGDSFDVKLKLGNFSTTMPLLITEHPLKSLTYIGTADVITLVKYENGNYGTSTTEAGTTEEWEYDLRGHADLIFRAECNNGDVIEGTTQEISKQIGVELWPYYLEDSAKWTEGNVYEAWIGGKNGVGTWVKLQVSEKPSFKSIEPLFEGAVQLTENVGYLNDVGNIRYDLSFADPKPQFLVKLTPDGEARFGIPDFKGTVESIYQRFSAVRGRVISDQDIEPWVAREEPYKITITLGTVSRDIDVKINASAVQSFQVNPPQTPVQVRYGSDAHLVMREGMIDWIYYYYLPLYEDDYTYTVNGKTYSWWELFNEFDETPHIDNYGHQMDDDRWEVGTEQNIKVTFYGRTYEVPVKVVEPGNYLKEIISCISDSPIIMAKGIHDKTNDEGRFSIAALQTKPVLKAKYYDEAKNATVTRPVSWSSFEDIFGAGLEEASDQSIYESGKGMIWTAGEHTLYVGMNGASIALPVKVIENPVAGLQPADEIIMSDRNRNADDVYPHYDMITSGYDAPEFILTLTDEGAALYNQGKKTFKGSLDEICRLLNYNGAGLITSDQSKDNVWTPGDEKDHFFTVHLGDDFEVPVTLVNTASLFKSLELADPNYVVELTEGADAESCFNGKFAYDICQDDDLIFKLTLTDDGMRYFGKSEKTFERTVSQIFDEFQYGVKIAAEPADWKVGETAEWTVGLSAGMFGGPDSNGPTCKIKAKLVAETQVESITCTNGPIALYKDVDFAWYDMDHPEWRNSYTLRWALESERVRFEVKLTNGDVIKGSRADILRKLGFCPVIDNTALAEQVENPWEINSADHAFTVYLGTKSCKVPVTVNEPNKITINEKSFPDENFRKYLKANWADETGTILAEDVRYIDCAYQGIKDLTGIELFPNLYDLNCGGNGLSELKISNANLRTLYCYENKLTVLDVSGCPNLSDLNCGVNLLTELDISHNTNLVDFYCYNNQLKKLDVSKNTKLTYLDCEGNLLDALDVSKNAALEILYCAGNKLTTLNVSNNVRLEMLDCSYNKLTVIYLPGTEADTSVLSRIAAFFAPATYANETNTMALTELNCSGNNLSEIDASSCKKLEKLTCVDNGSDKLTVNVAKLEGLNLATVGAENVKICENGKKVQGSSVGGEIAEQMNGAELTLMSTEGEKTYKTTVFGSAYRFDAVANGEYKLTITLKSDEGALVPYTTTVEIEGGKGLDLANVVLVQKGDVNLDGTIDVYDLQRLYEHASQINLLTGYALAVSNINGSGNAETNMQALFEQLTKTSKEGIDSAKTG